MELQDLEKGPSRRRFLKASAGGAALVLFGGLLTSHCATYPPLAGPPLQALDARTAAIFDAIADTLIDDGSGRLPIPSALGIRHRFDEMLQRLHPEIRSQSLMLLQAFEHLTTPFGLHFQRFTRLPLEQRKAYLESWATSSLGFRRMAFQALKMFVHLNYYTFPETWASLGYDGPWVGRLEIPYFPPPLAAYGDKEPL